MINHLKISLYRERRRRKSSKFLIVPPCVTKFIELLSTKKKRDGCKK